MNTVNILKVLGAVLLAVAPMCQAVEGTWTKKSNMPTARMGLSASTVNGRIYAIGGGNSIDGTAFRTVEEYDPTTDTWIRKANMPRPKFFHCAGVVNGKIYIIGGATAPNLFTPIVEEYDPVSDTWTRKANMPTTRGFCSASVVDGKIYVIGGSISVHEAMPILEQYDPLTDIWTRKADMPTARYILSASAVDGKIYAMGGVQGRMGGPGIATVEEYDPVNDTWTRKTDMPTARKNLSTFAISGKIYAVGGGTNIYGPTYSAVEEYDPKTDTWATKPDMLTARWFFSTSAANGNVYGIGGSLGDPHVAVSLVEEYHLIPPPPDFNGDGLVDIKDLLKLIESWGQDDPLVDIAPLFGDGVVDILDLEVLMSYWGQPFDDPSLVAHWALDETEGIIAYDSAGLNDAVVLGGTEWQPSGGQVNGSLQLNGVDGYAVTGLVLNPAEGPFSVFAWIKGGAPDQAIVSQMDGIGSGETWLGIEALNGCLMTGLVSLPIGRFIAEPLESNYIVTDNIWHHIGFVWDGSYRTLYVDGIEVAKDSSSLNQLKDSNGGLYIGVNKYLDAGTFFSGLIDDVRIYNRAVHP